MKKKVFVLLILAIFFAGGYYYLSTRNGKIELTQKEKELAMEALLGRKPVLTEKEVPQGNTRYKGKYFSLIYPQRANVYRNLVNGQEAVSQNLESFSFDLLIPKITVSVTVEKNPSTLPTSIDSNSGVRFRNSEPDMYTKSEITLSGGTQGLSFYKEVPPAEESAFFFVNNRFYSLVVTGNSISDIKEEFQSLISTFELY